MKHILQTVLGGWIIMLIMFSSCEKVVYPPPELPEPEDTVSYSLEIQPIWDGKCVNCHKGSRSPDLRPDVSYDELINGGYVNTDDPGSSILMNKLYGTHDSRATETEKQLILFWITQGAINN